MAIVALLPAMVTAERADAFIGESAVIDSGTGKLTSPAQTILTNPTFLQDFEDVAPPVQKTSLLRGLMGSRALPMVGRLLPAVGAAFLAYEVCNAIFSGCLSFTDSGGSHEKPIEWTWRNRPADTGVTGAKSHAMIFVSGLNGGVFRGKGWPSECSNGGDWPAEATGQGPVAGTISSKCTETWGSESKTGPAIIAERWPESWAVDYDGGVGSKTWSGSQYCKGWGSTDSCQSGADTSGWSAQMADYLKTQADPEVGQYVASQLPGSSTPNPYALTVEIPDCDGLLYPACADLLEERGLVPDRVERGWATADPAKDADEVLELDPAKATEVEKGSTVVVTTNPDEAGMPIVVPEPETGETYDHYAARLNPLLSPVRQDLTEAYIDTSKGPDEVVSTTPGGGTQLDPSTSHEVTVRTNPPEAPAPVAGWTPPPVAGIDITPLEGLGACGAFPFGLLCWVGEALGQFNTAGACPHFNAPVVGDLVETDFSVTLCGETTDTIMGYLRPALILAWTVGLGFLFARATRAIGGD